jgi:hypothetical protein
MSLHDLAVDGRALIRREDWRFRVAALIPPATRETDLSWFDGSFLVDLTPDGKWVLLGEGGEASQRELKVYVRRTDGSPAVALGEGRPLAISPDGSQALVALRAPFDKMTLVPTGVGQPRTLPGGDFTEVSWASFFADGARALLLGHGKDGARRLFIQALDSGSLRPVGPADVESPTPPSPDGTRAVVVQGKTALVVPFDGSAPQPLPRLRPGDQPLQWTADGKGLYVRRRPPGHPRHEAEIVVHDLATGAEKPWRVLVPPDPVGVARRFDAIVVARDGRAYAFGYIRGSTDLFVVGGLR